MSNTLPNRPLIDAHGRQVTYLRISVTDRCDFRCTYCMSEHMQFLPRSEVLSFEEIEAIAKAFIARGVTKIRLTGGEPLVRKDIMKLARTLGKQLETGTLQELTLTTNGSQLSRYASELAEIGIKRVNVSVDSLNPERFAAITRRGKLATVLQGIADAKSAGIAVKINMVPMRGVNEDEIIPMLEWAHGEDMDLTLIEEMPLGAVEQDRFDTKIPLTEIRDRLMVSHGLDRLSVTTGGPARYFTVQKTGGRLGFITPMSHNFCESCNRVRLTCTGELFMCLGQSDKVNLRDALRAEGEAGLQRAMDLAMILKPKGHDFEISRLSAPALDRHMSVTGG